MKNEFQIQAGVMSCKKCGSALGQFSASPEEALLKCLQCNTVYEEHFTDLQEVKMDFAQAPFHGREYIYLPFWQFLPRIKIFRRAIEKKSFLEAPVDTLKNRLFSPAFRFNEMKELANFCAFLTMNNPKYKLSPPYKFEDCVYNHFEAHRLARSIFLLIEAQEKDKIFGMDYELILDDPKIVILPFEVKGETLSSPFVHIEIHKRALG